MNLLHVITGLNDGGAESLLYHLCLETPQHQHSVICLSRPGKYSRLLSAHGIRVLHLCINPSNPFTWLSIVRAIPFVPIASPDIIQGWMYHGNLAASFLRVIRTQSAVIWTIHNTSLQFGRSSVLTIAINHILSILSHFIPSRIVACADSARYQHISQGYNSSRFITIYNGCSINKFSPKHPSHCQAFGIPYPHSVPVLGMVARFDPFKDHLNLLEALAHLKSVEEFVCYLVGNGVTDHNEYLTSHISRLGLRENVILLGPIDDVCGFMNAIDIHLLSSCAEAFPNVIIEAMACATPCVATTVGDIPLILKDIGFLARPQDPVSFATAIESAFSVYRTPSSWSLLKNANLSRSRDFTLETMAGHYSHLWSNLHQF